MKEKTADEIKGKNLLDHRKDIQNKIEFLCNHCEELVTAVGMNEYTKQYLENFNIYSFKIINKNIPIIIDNRLMNNEIMLYREKMSKSTEYIPYKEIKR